MEYIHIFQMKRFPEGYGKKSLTSLTNPVQIFLPTAS